MAGPTYPFPDITPEMLASDAAIKEGGILELLWQAIVHVRDVAVGPGVSYDGPVPHAHATEVFNRSRPENPLEDPLKLPRRKPPDRREIRTRSGSQASS